MLLGFESPKFVKLCIDYHPSKFQISWLSESNFMEISVRQENFAIVFGDDVFMTSFVIVELLNLHIL